MHRRAAKNDREKLVSVQTRKNAASGMRRQFTVIRNFKKSTLSPLIR